MQHTPYGFTLGSPGGPRFATLAAIRIRMGKTSEDTLWWELIGQIISNNIKQKNSLTTRNIDV